MATSHNPYAPTVKTEDVSVEAPELEKEEEVVETKVDPEKVPEGSASEVLDWVGDDKDRAKEALEAEEDGQQRIGLTKKLKELAE